MSRSILFLLYHSGLPRSAFLTFINESQAVLFNHLYLHLMLWNVDETSKLPFITNEQNSSESALY